MNRPPDSSWEKVENWYNQQVGEKGHYYHQSVILPGVLRLLEMNPLKEGHLLDLACGQGILARHLPLKVNYTGIDASPALIRAAQSMDKSKHHRYLTGDASKLLSIKEKNFSCGTLILALQNIEEPLKVFENFSIHLQPRAKLIVVLNHPCFRIPRQSSWGIDEAKKMQYRRIDRYFSSLKIPIQAHPSQKEKSVQTLSFHYSLSTISSWLKETGFLIESIEEWCSDKKSTGKAAAMENRARSEFPLFLTLSAIKTY